jgi:hypothetical protein
MQFNVLSNFAMKQAGGARGNWGTFLTIMLISLIALFIKVILVHWSYNEVVPNLFNEKYRKITMMEALYLVILLSALFN